MAANPIYPALITSRLTRIYDPFIRIFIPEMQIKRDLIETAHISGGQQVLDLGAGSGTLAIMVKQAHPDARVVALDSDPEILSIARRKASRFGVELSFEPGNVVSLPFSDQSFDRVISSLVMSLLDRETKQLAIQEACRVLKADGEIAIADFSRPQTRWGRMVSPLVRRFEPIADNLDGLIPVLIRQAGFINVVEPRRYNTLFGTITILSGCKP
jgi:ubiquinone/menaquinone biosynthesis C-methylase UbiE